MNSYKPLKLFMTSNGISILELAGKLGISRNNITQYFSGKGNPSLAILDRICEVLDCDISDVVRYEHTDSIDDKVKRYEEELRMCFVSPPSELEEFIKKMVGAYRKGLED